MNLCNIFHFWGTHVARAIVERRRSYHYVCNDGGTEDNCYDSLKEYNTVMEA